MIGKSSVKPWFLGKRELIAHMFDWAEEAPLPKVTCTSSDCARDLHTFLRLRPAKGSTYRNTSCRVCGVELVDWARVGKRDISDVQHTMASLERELIRHHYWHKSIDDTAMRHAKRKGLVGLREAARNRICKYVAPPRSSIFRDGTQTGKGGNTIFYAQHATATCCRKCAEAWHGIDREQRLSGQEIDYMTDLVMQYIRRRLPDLPLEGVAVARRRRKLPVQIDE